MQPGPCAVTITISFPTVGASSALGQAGGEAAMRAAPALMESASRALLFCHQECALLASPVPRARRSKQSVSRILCSHLGPSFPIYLVVSLNPSPHTTDIFLI